MKSWVTHRRLAAGILALVLFDSWSSAFAAVGRTEATYQVSPSGAATYTIPIFAPRGPNGLQPQIALTYDSQSSNGYLGVGWNLAGLSVIYRCNQTYAQDPAPAPVTLTMSDVFCMDGQRLRLTGGTYGDAGSTYQTEVANFSNVTADGSIGNGPAYFEVQGRDGSTYEYGNGPGSQVSAVDTATAWMWYLDKVTDRAGNTMTISYCPGGTPNCTPSGSADGSAVPRTIAWTPSTSGSTSYNYTMTFGYGTNHIPIYGYVAGTPVSNSSLLTSITVAYSGTGTVKYYALSYQQSATTGRDLLTSVQECADSGETNCLTATQFGYQVGAQGVAQNATTAFSATATELKTHNDFNGDGLNDLAYCNGGSPNIVFVAFASASGYGSPINTGIPCNAPLYGDIAGAGKDGILVPNGTDWWYYIWNGSSFSGQDTGLAYDSTASQYVLADVNGDGLPDLIAGYLTTQTVGSQIVFSYSIYVRLNTGTAGTASFSNTSSLWYGPTSPQQAIMISDTDRPYGATSYGTLKGLDFNGDGRQDIALETIIPSGGGNYAVDTYELVSTGSSFTPTLITAGGASSSYGATTFLDFNSDGCTDYLYNSTLYISGCNGTQPITKSLGAYTVIGAMDWDGDGQTDILVNNGGTIGVFLSDGDTTSTLQSTTVPYISSNLYFAFDTNGDGLDDLGVYTSSGTVAYYPHNGAGQKPDLLNSITDGYGNTIKPTYTSIAQGAYSNYAISPSSPYELALPPLYVVSNVTFSDPTNPPNGTYSQAYSYVGYWKNMQGRGFSNFINVVRHDSRKNVWKLDCYENKFPFSGVHACTRLSLDQAGNQVIRDRFGNHALITLDGTYDNGRVFIYQNAWTDKKYQLSWSESAGNTVGPLIETDSTSYQYDDYGNATNVATTRTDNDSNSPYLNDSWTTTVANTFEAPDTATWCFDLLSQSTVTYTASDGSTTEAITRQYTPDAPPNCRYTEIETQPSTAYQVAEAFTYDDFGNMKTDTVTGSGMTARETQANWGATGQFPMSFTNALSQAAQFNYDFRYGLVSSRTDPNNLTTSWTYGDGFGRLTQENRPDGTYTTYSYNDCVNWDGCPLQSHTLALSHTVHNKDGSNQSVGTVWEDSVERQVLSNESLLAAGTWDRNEVRYDSLGNVAKRAFPCVFSAVSTLCPYWTTYTYDALNRVTELQRPTSSQDGEADSTDYAYSGRSTTITDGDGNARTIVTDVLGNQREVKDATGYTITLGYDAAGGHISTVDSLGNTLWTGTVRYGIAPFTVAATDADLGPWTYTYDALGDLKSWTDAKGQTFSQAYDALSRPVTRSEPDLFTQWTWGTSAASHNIGQLASVCTGTGSHPTSCTATSGYAESETYDGAARLSQRTITIPGDTQYTYKWVYDANTGLLDTLTYPTSTAGYALTLSYTYSSGILRSITDSSDSPAVTLWTANTANARGQVLQETLGNGVVVNHGFDDVTGLPGTITAGVGGGDALQDNSYLFDAVGNLTQRDDINAGVTESVYYDSLNRLSHTVGDTSTQLTYDSMGRLSTWEASGASTNTKDYTTPQTGCTYYAYSQPHAVRRNTQGSWPPNSYCYDANGNMTTVSSSGTVSGSYTWMSFNQPNKLSAPTYSSSSQFFYDGNHQRYEQIASYSGSPETTEYIGGLTEKMTNATGTAYRYYISAGNNVIVYNRWVSGGTTGLYYVTTGPLGSSDVITDHTGALVVAEKYSALGWNENTTAQEATMASVTRHGYTGQEGMENAGLGMVNLNGRILIPSGNTMLSADPAIPDPTRTVGYNRYAYAYYSPLTYNDPTGYVPTCVYVAPEAPSDDDYSDDGSGDYLPPATVSASQEPLFCFDFDGGGGGGGSNPYNPNHGGGGGSTPSGGSPAAPPPPRSSQCASGQPCNQQQPQRLVCRAATTVAGAAAGAVGGATFALATGNIEGIPVAAATGAVVGGVVAAVAPNGGFSGALTAAVASFVVHAPQGMAGEDVAQGAAEVGGDTISGGITSPNAALPIGVGTGAIEGAVAETGVLAAAGTGGGALIGANAGGLAALAALATNSALLSLAHHFLGCP